MNDLRQAAQQALEALKYHVEQTRPIHRTNEAIDALRAALEKTVQEPVAMKTHGAWDGLELLDGLPDGACLYTAPPQQAEPVLQTCNCRWDGEVQVQQCTLHEAHVDAIHEWAERAKVAERKLAQQAEPVEPVAWYYERDTDKGLSFAPDRDPYKCWQPLHAAPPQRRPLSDEKISDLWCEVSNTDFVTADTHVFARAVERAHGITDPQIEDRLARHGIPMPGDPK